jgi:thioredoxin-related protein
MQKWKGSFLSEWKGLFLSVWILVFSSAEKPRSGSMPEGGRGVRSASIGQKTASAGELSGNTELSGTGKDKKSPVTWMTLAEAAGKLQNEKRPVLIDLYTSWCGWCRQMDRSTYSNRHVAQYLQEKFYPVKLDAETHAVINWNGKSYSFSPEFRSNEFAVYLTGGRLEFPTTIIIPPGGEPQAIPGYMEPKELELLVRYFGEGNYNKMSFEDFQKQFKASW